MTKTFSAVLILLALTACGKKSQPYKSVSLKNEGLVSVLLLGVENTEEIKTQSKQMNITVSGDEVLILEGEASSISQLQFKVTEDFMFEEDSAIRVEAPVAHRVESQLLYLAKKEFGLLDFWKKYPLADGRGVKVGIIDDGISPNQQGFILTTTGERKFLKKATQSTFTTYDLKETELGLEAEIDETRKSFKGAVDLNGNGEFDVWKILIPTGSEKVCIADICKESFSKSGEYFLTKDGRTPLMFELDLENKKIQFFQPEKGTDSHGEGVASVLAGHKIGNLTGFDGVAPGAKILDYDLSEASNIKSENEYTIGTFLKAIEWLGKEGAEVANISYSLYFTNAKSQVFMSKALDKIIKKYNMVVSFSAGNNGPGLGSLNRRAIYPNSALVAGAYVSRELDEYVHGVTGLPEEGRVVYYSSRGPGLGEGPLLIAPLSSLTNSTPEEGHRAFSGTSSASPALAGAATVVISAIKQEGLPYDASTVVHALKLSGRRLEAEPFIFQGYGLPQVEKALGIYKELISGKQMMGVRVSTDSDKIDDVNSTGIFLKTSENFHIVGRRITLKGIISSLAPSETKTNLLTPIKIVYSNGITGASNLWVSSSNSNFHIDIDVSEILGSNLEGFGEIKLLALSDNSLLGVIPVTVVRDQSVLEKPETTLRLSSQEGLRFPIHVPVGVDAFKVKVEVLEGEGRNVVASVFDPNQVRSSQQRIGTDIIVPVIRPGFHQIGFSMAGGTKRSALIKVSIERLSFELKTKVTKANEGSIRVKNLGNPLSVTVKLTPRSEVVSRVLVSSKDLSSGAQITKDLTEGKYVLSLRPTEVNELEYFYSSCNLTQQKTDGTIESSSGSSFEVAKEGSSVTARCMPFDSGAEFEEEMAWELRLLRSGLSKSFRVDMTTNQTSTISTKDMVPGTYSVEVVDPFSGASFTLGTVDLI